MQEPLSSVAAPVTRLIEEFHRLPGIGPKSAQRLTYHILRAPLEDAKALADAIRKTDIKDNVSTGPGIQFDAKGHNDKLRNSAIQNRGGKLVTIAPKTASNAKPEHPMKPYNNR